jgi:hypothetical protein
MKARLTRLAYSLATLAALAAALRYDLKLWIDSLRGSATYPPA